jgi:beta-glucosidase
VIHGLKTIFPVPLGLAASWDPQMVEQVQGLAAAEARAVGIHWTFSPMVDIARDPRWGRIVEGAGEDPYLGAAMAAAQVRGFQGERIGSPGHLIAGPKHFAGYGAALGGRDYDEVTLSDEELWNVYLPPFKAALEAGAGSIMSAYMPLNGVPATANHWLVNKVLRDTWGFKGFVVSDNGAVASLITQGLAADTQDAAARALNAGLDVEMVRPFQQAAFQSLPAALAAGKISEAELDDAVRVVLEAKLQMGLFDNPFVDEQKAQKVLDDPAHFEAARIAAERSAVLLRNESNLLPLDRKTIKSMAVIGPLADADKDILGPWVFKQNQPKTMSLLAGLRARLGNSIRIDYSEGVRLPARLYPSPLDAFEGPGAPKPPLDETAEIQRATAMARAADVAVLVLGEAQNMIGEIASRSSLELPGRQQELLDAVVATGKPVVVLLMSARPLDLKDTKAAAVMDLWYPGSAGGLAVADLLFGAGVPGGKLPFTWVRNAAQVPLIYSHLVSHDPDHAEQRYWNESNQPRYPFGYGLSYTTFQYSNLRIARASYAVGESIPVEVDLKNTGRITGDEVAQLYIHQRSGTSARPVRELKGFQRASLKPGETRTLRFTLAPQDLGYWSAVTGTWVHDASKFDVWVGGSSAAELAGSFEIAAAN